MGQVGENVVRIEAEALRDALLSVSGKLNVKAFGPPVPVTNDEVGQVVVGNDIRNPGDGTPMGKVAPLGGEEYRRSVYVQVRRSLPLAQLEAFDAPAMTPNCESRSFSTISQAIAQRHCWGGTLCCERRSAWSSTGVQPRCRQPGVR